jgi:hypothetical protein
MVVNKSQTTIGGGLRQSSGHWHEGSQTQSDTPQWSTTKLRMPVRRFPTLTTNLINDLVFLIIFYLIIVL